MNFYNTTGSVGDHSYPACTQAKGLLLYGEAELKHCMIRHQYDGLYINARLANPIEECTVEQCFLGLYAWDSSTTITPAINVGNSQFLDCEGPALYLMTQNKSNLVRLSACTIDGCNMGAYIQSVTPSFGSALLLDGCIVTNCEAGGVVGEDGSDTGQAVTFDGVTFLWNNGSTPADNVDDDHLVLAGEPWLENPLMVTAPSVASGTDAEGHYLLQESGDVSRTPLRIGGVDSDDETAVSNIENWPSGVWEVGFYGLDDIASPDADTWRAGFSASDGVFAKACQAGYTDIHDLLVTVKYVSGTLTSNGEPQIELTLANGATIEIYLKSSKLTSMSSGGVRAYWVAQDGSTFYARSDHAAGTDYETDVVTQDARYAMR